MLGKLQNIRVVPSLTMNRDVPLGSYIAQTEFETERSKGAYMDLEVSAMWDKEKNNITVTPNVTFRLNREEAPYGFAYVLTEVECQAITGNKLTFILDARSFVAYQMNSIILSMPLELFIILKTTLLLLLQME